MPDYDSIVAGMAVASDGNKYDPVVARMRGEQETARARAALTVSLSADQNPDQAALHNALAKRYNTSPDVVAAFPQEFKDRMALELARSNLDGAPGLQLRIANQPQTAALIHDDIPNAAALERNLTSDIVAGVRSSSLKVLGAWDKAATALSNLLPDGTPGKMTTEQGAYFEGRGQYLQGLAFLPDNAPQRWTGQVAGALTYLPFGSVAPYVMGGSEGTARTQDLISQGVDTTTAGRAGLTEGALLALMMHIPMGNVLWGQGAKTLAKSVVTSGARAGTVGAAQSVLSDEAASQLLRGGGYDALADRYAPSLDKALESATFMSAFHLGMQGLHRTAGAGAVNDLAQELTASEKAQHDYQRLATIGELAASSKWRGRDPEGFNDFVRTVSEQGDLPNVYVDAKAFAQAADRAGMSATDLQRTLPDAAQQLSEGLMTEGFVRIPTADYAGAIAGTKLGDELLPHLRSDPEAKSYAEAQAFYQEQSGLLRSTAASVVAAKQGADAQRTADQAVRNAVETRLNELGRFTPDVNRVNAAITSAIVNRLAAHEGINPGDALAKYGPQLVAEPLVSGLEQPARGMYAPDTRTIALLKDADLSTYLHETGHWALDTYMKIAARPDAPAPLRADADHVLRWFGVESPEKWQGLSLDQQRPHHEQFARAFEAYLMEGKAPSHELHPFFVRIRNWLVHIYRELRSLDVPLTSEVRGVFDRMLASEAAIREVQATRNFNPLFTEKPAGVSGQEWAEYEHLGAQAMENAVEMMASRSLRDMKWLTSARERAVRATNREAVAARREVRAQAEKEVASEPVYQVEDFIRTNKLKTDDIDWDALAEQFGFPNGEAALRAMRDAAPRAQVVEGLTDRYMLEQHSELASPEAIEQAANEAVHNEARGRFMATGLKLLTRSPISSRELQRAADEAADFAIGRTRVRDLNPRQYLAAETRSNREALKLVAKDARGAAIAQRAALLNNRLVTAAYNALADIRATSDYQRRFDRESVRKKLDPDILEQIDSLRERFDFRATPPGGPTHQRQSLQAWVNAQKAVGYTPVESPEMLNEHVRTHYQDLTIEQLRGFSDTLRSMERIARERKRIRVAGKEVELTHAVGQLVDKMRQRGDRFTDKELADRPRAGVDPLWNVALDRAEGWLRTLTSELKGLHFKANQYDMHEVLGPFRELIFEPLFEANYRKLDMQKALSERFGKFAEDYLGKEWQKDLMRVVENRALLDHALDAPEPRRLTMGDVFSIALHTGNESNFDKLTKGMGWNGRDVWQLLDANMTEKHWRAVQEVWDAFESYWPQMVEMNRRLGNVSPEHVQPRAFNVRTADGKQFALRGGYAPIKYDSLRSKLSRKLEANEAINPAEGLFSSRYYRADTTTNGSLNARVADYHDFIDLDFHRIEEALHDTVHDLAYRETLIDAHKIVTDKEFRQQFRRTYGPEEYRHVLQHLGRVANAEVLDDTSSAFVNFMRATRRAVVANGIAFRVSTVLKHGGSAGFKTMGYFSGGGEKYLAEAFKAISMDHEATVRWAMEKSPEIRSRALQQDRDYRQAIASLVQPESPHAKAERFGHAAVAYADFFTAVPTFRAAYYRTITEGIPKNRGGTGKPMSEEDAVRYANGVVREAHGNPMETNRSLLMSNPSELFKALTTLHGFMNNTFGQLLDSYDKLRTAGFSKPEVLARYWMAIIVAAVWAGLLEGQFEHEDEPWWIGAMKSIGGEHAAMVPMARDAWHAVEGYHSAGVPPWMSALGAVAKPAHDAYDAARGKDVKHPIKDIGNAAGLLLPGLGQAGTTAQYIYDRSTGAEDEPDSALQAVRDAALGPRHNH